VSRAGRRTAGSLALLILLGAARAATAQELGWEPGPERLVAQEQAPPGSEPPPGPAGPGQEPMVRSEEPILPPVLVTAPPPFSASSQQMIPGTDFELRPQGRPADILRLVPGMVIAQHQGGGKADQMLIRGFDADHGSDFALFLDGMPINFRSHAHGQGYADLHFLIPETIQGIDVTKGPYFAEFGDFNTAGAMVFHTKDFVLEDTFQAAGGSWDTQRYLAVLSPTRDTLKTLIAVEGYYSDGPFDHPNRYNRINALAKASAEIAPDMKLAILGTFYYAQWNGSGQIPERAVREQLIDRFGAIDPSEGAKYTQRANLIADYAWKVADDQTFTANAYLTYYTLSLFNNFTFFLDDPNNGDQNNQQDHRWMGGLNTRYDAKSRPFDMDLTSTAGFQYRIDAPNVILANATQRHRTGVQQNYNLVESSYSPFIQADVVPVEKVRIIGGLRGDIFNFQGTQLVNETGGSLNGNITQGRLNEKINVVLGPWYQTEFFGNFGTGFHSNDARAVLENPGKSALPTATGYEFGFKTTALPRTELSATYWFLNLQSELIFDQDSGTLVPAGATHREGLEVASKVRLLDWLTFDGNFSWTTRAVFFSPTLANTPDPFPGRRIPLAPVWTSRWDLTARLPSGFSSDLGMIYVSPRPLDPDYLQTARGYTIFNLTGRYRYRNWEAFLSIENLFNVEWREAQYYFTSRLPGEPAAGVPDIHFTPGNPRTFIGGLAFHY